MRAPDHTSADGAAVSHRATEGEPVVEFGKRLGVLVVDDDHLVRITLQLWLERNGFDVWSATSGWQAIEPYRTEGDRIAVVVLDLCMPGLDGLRTLNRLRELNPRVLACLMSGDAAACESDDLLQHGATSVIAKPFRLEQLTNVLRRVMHRVPAEPLASGGQCRQLVATERI